MIEDHDKAHPVPDEPARIQWVSTPRHWVITAVATGALMLTAAWPVPTLIGLGAGGVVLTGARAWVGRRPDGTAPADGPLTGAGTSGSNECTGCVGCGGPDCIERRADGALTGDSTARDRVADAPVAASARAIVASVPRQQLHDAIRQLAREDPTWWRAELDYIARSSRYRAWP